MVRTLVEIQGDRVSVSVDGALSEVVLPERKYTAEEVAAAQNSEVALVTKGLNLRISELKATVGELMSRIELSNELETDLKEAIRDRDRYQDLAAGYDRDRKTERDRANRKLEAERDRADRLNAELERRTQERDEREAARADLERKFMNSEQSAVDMFRIVGRIAGVVYGPEVGDDITTCRRSPMEGANRAAEMLVEIRKLVGGPPGPPTVESTEA